MIEKNNILQLITEEKDIYSKYLSICKIYNAQPDIIITAKHEAIFKSRQNMKQVLERNKAFAIRTG